MILSSNYFRIRVPSHFDQCHELIASAPFEPKVQAPHCHLEFLQLRPHHQPCKSSCSCPRALRSRKLKTRSTALSSPNQETMWLTNTSHTLESISGPEDHLYAILSRTSGDKEGFFWDMARLDRANGKARFGKIEQTCSVVHTRGLPYA